MSSETITNCERCGKRCRGTDEQSKARFIRKGKFGVCTECAVAKAFQQLNNMHGGALPMPEALRYEHVREQFGRVLVAGNSDLKLDDIDWDEVIANWHLDHDKGTLF